MSSFFDRFKFKKKPFRDRKAVATATAEKPKSAERAVAHSKHGAAVGSGAHRVLVRPVVSEKSTRLMEERTYVFEVSRVATKEQVKQAIVAVYGVRPQRVNMAVVSGHPVRFGKVAGKMRDWKKAIVTLPAGAKIDLTAKD